MKGREFKISAWHCSEGAPQRAGAWSPTTARNMQIDRRGWSQ